jgi:SARP family transcriptional regulator, regulator of embCAB operon
LRYEILGPLRVIDERGTFFIRTQKAEILLAVLLIRSNQVVSKGQLMAEIWGDHIPRRGSACIHVYISQLRKFLNRPDRRDSPIMTVPPGYLLRLGSDELDLHMFQELADRGRTCAREGHHDEAVACFEEALSLWRGTMLDDLDTGPIMDGFATWLDELRMECIEMSVDSQLEMGRHRELIGRLYSLTAEYPLRESFYRQLMLALYGAERQADALGVYQSARAKLHDELGLEPCRALQELHQAVLTADSRLDVNAAAPLELQRA